MKNTSSSSSHEPILLPKQHVPIEHIKEAHVENFEKDASIVTRKSERQMTAKSFFIITLYTTWMTLQEPYSFLDANLQKEAIQIEMDSIMYNGTWKVVERP